MQGAPRPAKSAGRVRRLSLACSAAHSPPPHPLAAARCERHASRDAPAPRPPRRLRLLAALARTSRALRGRSLARLPTRFIEGFLAFIAIFPQFSICFRHFLKNLGKAWTEELPRGHVFQTSSSSFNIAMCGVLVGLRLASTSITNFLQVP